MKNEKIVPILDGYDELGRENLKSVYLTISGEIFEEGKEMIDAQSDEGKDVTINNLQRENKDLKIKINRDIYGITSELRDIVDQLNKLIESFEE